MTSCKVKELSAILVHSSRPMGTNTCLITIPISSSRCIEIPQDEKSISPGALINHRLESGIKCILHGVMYPSSHNMLVDRCYLIYHWSQLIGHCYSNSLGMVTITATRPIVGVTTRHDLAIIWSLTLSAAIPMSKCLSSDENRQVIILS